MPAKEIESNGTGSLLRVLIVDDAETDAAVMVARLSEAGFIPEAQRVDNPEQFRTALTQPWDVVLCDCAMPRFAPGEALQLLRRFASGIPLIMVSNSADQDVVRCMMRDGARDFVSKTSLERLGSVIQRELGQQVQPLPESVMRPSWRIVLDRLERLITRRQQPFALVVLDVERFRRINHGLGYAQGERLLGTVIARLSRSGGLYLGRLRSDELLVGLPLGPDQPPLEVSLTRLRTALARPFSIDGTEFILNFSQGVALYPEHGRDPESLLRHAESEVSAMKRERRVHGAHPTTEASHQLRLEQELYGAMERGEFSLFYQPQVAIDDRRVIGMEALMRWNHPVLGQISPVQFIPLAEETGIIVELGAWALETACSEAAHWHRQGGGHLRIGVNLSACQFRYGDLAATVERALSRSGLFGGALELELTESTLIADPEGVSRDLHRCRELGARISVDDFGTGYSSLSYLRWLPLDVLKIDRSFVADLGQDPRAQALVEGLIGMSRGLGMETIAEGVETEIQAAVLLEAGCTCAQGHYFSPPLDEDSARAFIGRGV